MIDREQEDGSFYRRDPESALLVENLSKIYVSSMGKVVYLRNVSFSVNKGEFVSVVGPKTLKVPIIFGLIFLYANQS